jgi:hypothetical protein
LSNMAVLGLDGAPPPPPPAHAPPQPQRGAEGAPLPEYSFSRWQQGMHGPLPPGSAAMGEPSSGGFPGYFDHHGVFRPSPDAAAPPGMSMPPQTSAAFPTPPPEYFSRAAVAVAPLRVSSSSGVAGPETCGVTAAERDAVRQAMFRLMQDDAVASQLTRALRDAGFSLAAPRSGALGAHL